MWRPVDWFADWLRHCFGVKPQLRMGVLMFWMGVAFCGYAPFTQEPLLVFIMSALALVFGGISVVVTAETLDEVTEDGE